MITYYDTIFWRGVTNLAIDRNVSVLHQCILTRGREIARFNVYELM